MGTASFAPETWTEAFLAHLNGRLRFLDQSIRRVQDSIARFAPARDAAQAHGLSCAAGNLHRLHLDRQVACATEEFVRSLAACGHAAPRTATRLWLGDTLVKCALYDADHPMRQQRDAVAALLHEIIDMKGD